MATTNQTILKRDAQGNVIQDSYVGDMTFRGEYTGTNLIYKGYARPGASEGASVWQIARITYDGSNNATSVLWPQGPNLAASSEFNFSWTSRATYTYS
jgi:hypothetical protein